MKYNIGDKVRVVKIEKLEGNTVAPPLKIGEEKTVLGIAEDKENNQHIDVGIISEYNYIRSFETKEELPNGDRIHWCHPSRFEII